MSKIIKDVGPTKRRIDPKIVAAALGAEATRAEIDPAQGPISLFSLRQFMVSRLRSTGGRPRLEGTQTKRNKIPVFNDDWKKIEEFAGHYRKDGVNVSSGQIASALIHIAISKIDTGKINVRARSSSGSSSRTAGRVAADRASKARRHTSSP